MPRFVDTDRPIRATNVSTEYQAALRLAGRRFANRFAAALTVGLRERRCGLLFIIFIGDGKLGT